MLPTAVNEGATLDTDEAGGEERRPIPQLEVAEALDVGGEALEGLGELPRAARRGPSVAWWESSTTETLSEPELFAEYILDSADTSVSSTRASTNTRTTGSISRLSRGRMSGYVVIRGAHRSPSALFEGAARRGYRGRSVTRRERSLPSAAMRHRHPTHTPNRRIFAAQRLGMPFDAGGTVSLFHEIGRVGEEPTGESGL